MLIDGVHVPLATPFYGDGRSYLKKLEHNVGRYSLTPAAGLVALAPGGEAAGLSDEETAETLKTVSAIAAPEKVLVAGIAKDSVREALRVAEQAEAAGFDALLLSVPTSWAKLREAERMVWFRAVADRAELPVFLYSAGELSVEMIAELALHGNIAGLYDAELSVERYRAIAAATQDVKREVSVTTVFAPVTRRMAAPKASGPATFVSAASLGGGSALAVAAPAAAIKTRTKVVGFQVMSAGTVGGMVELLEAGVAGVLPTLAACAPQGCHEAYAAFKDGDPALARLKADRLMAADALMVELGVAGVKYGCDLNGYYGGAPRLPRLALDAADRSRVERVLAGLKN
jgi:dihydrodipicolinate synthase/N-acetylneuraminate lyase